MAQPTPEQIEAALAPLLPAGGEKYRKRLVNQIMQLLHHGNSAEVVVRTSAEASDLLNFARLWEYILNRADRKTRGLDAEQNRAMYEETLQNFNVAQQYMADVMRQCIKRHGLDFTGQNFISRIAQRYGIAEPAAKKD